MESPFDYSEAWNWLEQKGKNICGKNFRLYTEDSIIINKLLCYFFQDHLAAPFLELNLTKGLMLTGPIGCGKTSLMRIMAHLCHPQQRHIMKSCRDISFEFHKEGYEVLQRYSRSSANKYEPQALCFDDLGTEQVIKYFGNDCNVMREILLTRYDLFISRQLITHLTTNLNATELEDAYGPRLRSRLREMFNLLAFDTTSKDKRR